MKKFSDMEIDEVINVINTFRKPKAIGWENCSDVSTKEPLTTLSAFSTTITSL